MKRNQWIALVFAVLLFTCGVAVGALADHYYARKAVFNPPTAQSFREQYISEMREKVKLTPGQLTQLEQILDETKAKVKAVRDASHPAMLKIREEQIARVKAILTPQQIPAYEQLVAEHQQHAKEQEERERQEEQRHARDHHQPTP